MLASAARGSSSRRGGRAVASPDQGALRRNVLRRAARAPFTEEAARSPADAEKSFLPDFGGSPVKKSELYSSTLSLEEVSLASTECLASVPSSADHSDAECGSTTGPEPRAAAAPRGRVAEEAWAQATQAEVERFSAESVASSSLTSVSPAEPPQTARPGVSSSDILMQGRFQCQSTRNPFLALQSAASAPSRPAASMSFSSFRQATTTSNSASTPSSSAAPHLGRSASLATLPLSGASAQSASPNSAVSHVLPSFQSQSSFPSAQSVRSAETAAVQRTASFAAEAKAEAAPPAPAVSADAAAVRTQQKPRQMKKKPRFVRACPAALARREIPTKPTGPLAPNLLYKYRCPGGQGIQVPALRMESAPTKLSNWRVSWQELLCYNPRSYGATPLFKENYVVMRAGLENYISNITDIVFVDRNSAHQNPAYVYHAYLVPPVTPHDYSTAACIQCYTSDDSWLARGAWKREVRKKGTVETMQPANPLVLPFAPPEGSEETNAQHFRFRSKAAHPLYGTQAVAHAQNAKKKLPLHLWVFLSGKDMQALDGIVLTWKFLRFASEIPPGEFVEGPGEATAPTKEGAMGARFWGANRASGQGQYHQYHSAGRNPAQDQTVDAAGAAPQSTNGPRSFSPFGPFIYDTKGVEEEKKYRVSFLMVDIPGYGNSSGHPSPDTIRSNVLQAVKHALMELVEHHEEDDIVVNILGYSLGCAVALSLAADLAECIAKDVARAQPARADSNASFGASGRIATASQAWEEKLKAAKWDERPPSGNNGKVHSGISFDDSNLTFRDTCNLTMFEENGRPHVVPLDTEFASEPQKTQGLRLGINRLVLLAPFTSIQAMAGRVAAATVGGGGLISRAASALVSRQINWDNEVSMKRLFESMYKIQSTSQADVFRNFRLYIQHGDHDNVIPWTMGYELFSLAKSLRSAYNMSHIPLKFDKMPGETHATILSGQSEMTLLENCFAPYRLHPAAPLALLKFYSRVTHLPAMGVPPRSTTQTQAQQGQSTTSARRPPGSVRAVASNSAVYVRANTAAGVSFSSRAASYSTVTTGGNAGCTYIVKAADGRSRRLRYSNSDSVLAPEGSETSQGTGEPPSPQDSGPSPISQAARASSTAGANESYSAAFAAICAYSATSTRLTTSQSADELSKCCFALPSNSGATVLSSASRPALCRSGSSVASYTATRATPTPTEACAVPVSSGAVSTALPPLPTSALTRSQTSLVSQGSMLTQRSLGSHASSVSLLSTMHTARPSLVSSGAVTTKTTTSVVYRRAKTLGAGC
ncbi:hypothetical protein BESB_079030 [Besnoitia besnoiti]|uniref:Alpha/beta hydrolase family protein n=1 Tax=Besnoitia besnoiti TaxID=94643 RepID=A0A2A9MDK0_BESBE|nr:hypothetical protein BESB_079030 [Besnoitia besnoiti]PFH33687.1 hypothetical protein BESB_079030 [Besnoitia besnoiti]